MALLGSEGDTVDLPTTRAVGAQLRSFDVCSTTPRAEWIRLQSEAFSSDAATFSARAVLDTALASVRMSFLVI